MIKKDESIYRVIIRAKEESSILELMREKPLDISCGGPRREQDGTIILEVFISSTDLDYLREKELTIEVIEDLSTIGQERQMEVHVGDRFEGGKQIPHGPGIKE